jgi:hypothetical protein
VKIRRENSAMRKENEEAVRETKLMCYLCISLIN